MNAHRNHDIFLREERLFADIRDIKSNMDALKSEDFSLMCEGCKSDYPDDRKSEIESRRKELQGLIAPFSVMLVEKERELCALQREHGDTRATFSIVDVTIMSIVVSFVATTASMPGAPFENTITWLFNWAGGALLIGLLSRLVYVLPESMKGGQWHWPRAIFSALCLCLIISILMSRMGFM